MKQIYLLIILLTILTSCGDLFMKDREDSEVELAQFSKCELDIDAFSYIFEKNIKGDIECLKDKLHLFMDTVKTTRPGYISKAVLKKFLTDGPIDVDDNIVDIVDSVFDLNFVLRGSDRDFIKREDVDILLDFLVTFNQHIWQSYKYFTSPDKVNYSRHIKERSIIFNELAIIGQELSKIYIPNRDNIDRIDTERFLYNFFQGEISTLEKIRSLMFLKRVMFGGQVWDLTHVEVANVIKSLPYIAQAAFDIVKIDRYEFDKEQETLIKIFIKDIDVIKRLLFYDGNSHEQVFTVYDVINAISTNTPDLLPFDVTKFPKEIMQLKDVFLGSSSEIFSARELVSLLDQVSNLLDEGALYYRVYSFYKNELDSEEPITHDFSDFPVNNSDELNYLKQFARIVQNYKFLKGSFTAPFFTFNYHRNENAIFEVKAIEYVVEKAMAYYGRSNQQARGKYDITLEQTVAMVDDFKWFLKDQGIITIGRKGGGEVASVADNLVLMSTLFQKQSNGCDPDTVCMEIPETTEFIIGLLTALDVKDFFTNEMMSLCQNDLDQYDRISPECFRNNFIKVIEGPIPGDGRSLADYMPLLYSYLKDLVSDISPDQEITNSPDYMKFITETETFTRSCTHYDEAKTDEVYLRANDAFAVFADLLNVESTLIRFDEDQNNKIDARNSKNKNEVLTAYYEVYKGAIVAMSEDQLGSAALAKLLAKPIFQYLVRYGSVPDTSQFSSIWKFVRFILKRNKNADITRTTVASILKTIGEQSENAALHPFKCEECLRDPTIECIPEGDNWSY